MANDKLEDMLIKQEALMARYAEDDDNFPPWPIDFASKSHQKFVRDNLLNCVDELFEASRSFKNWKRHRKTHITDFNKDEFLEESIDALKYMLEVFILCGVSSDELKNAFDKKDAKCHKRIDENY